MYESFKDGYYEITVFECKCWHSIQRRLLVNNRLWKIHTFKDGYYNNRRKNEFRFNDVLNNDDWKSSLNTLINRRKKPFFSSVLCSFFILFFGFQGSPLTFMVCRAFGPNYMCSNWILFIHSQKLLCIFPSLHIGDEPIKFMKRNWNGIPL